MIFIHQPHTHSIDALCGALCQFQCQCEIYLLMLDNYYKYMPCASIYS